MSDQPQALWLAAQQTLRGMLKTELYNLWFAPVSARSLDGDVLTLEVADEFCTEFEMEGPFPPDLLNFFTFPTNHFPFCS